MRSTIILSTGCLVCPSSWSCRTRRSTTGRCGVLAEMHGCWRSWARFPMSDGQFRLRIWLEGSKKSLCSAHVNLSLFSLPPHRLLQVMQRDVVAELEMELQGRGFNTIQVWDGTRCLTANMAGRGIWCEIEVRALFGVPAVCGPLLRQLRAPSIFNPPSGDTVVF